MGLLRRGMWSRDRGRYDVVRGSRFTAVSIFSFILVRPEFAVVWSTSTISVEEG